MSRGYPQQLMCGCLHQEWNWDDEFQVCEDLTFSFASNTCPTQIWNALKTMAKWFSNYYLVTSLTQEVTEYFPSQGSHYLSMRPISSKTRTKWLSVGSSLSSWWPIAGSREDTFYFSQ